jgi:hypothetical protein
MRVSSLKSIIPSCRRGPSYVPYGMPESELQCLMPVKCHAMQGSVRHDMYKAMQLSNYCLCSARPCCRDQSLGRNLGHIKICIAGRTSGRLFFTGIHAIALNSTYAAANACMLVPHLAMADCIGYGARLHRFNVVHVRAIVRIALHIKRTHTIARTCYLLHCVVGEEPTAACTSSATHSTSS